MCAQPTRLSHAQERLAELLKKHPEFAPYTRSVTAGDVHEIIKRLDEIATLLRGLTTPGAGR